MGVGLVGDGARNRADTCTSLCTSLRGFCHGSETSELDVSVGTQSQR